MQANRWISMPLDGLIVIIPKPVRFCSLFIVFAIVVGHLKQIACNHCILGQHWNSSRMMRKGTMWLVQNPAIKITKWFNLVSFLFLLLRGRLRIKVEKHTKAGIISFYVFFSLVSHTFFTKKSFITIRSADRRLTAIKQQLRKGNEFGIRNAFDSGGLLLRWSVPNVKWQHQQ